MSKNINIGYNITNDPNLLKNQNSITPELSKLLQRFHKVALKGKKSSIPKILDAIEKYPENPQLKNYLSALYERIGDTEKAYETTRWIVAEHPNYLFGKLNLANEYHLKKEYHKMPEILGDAMELKALYPHRDTFHINEVTSFLKSTILYFTAIGDIEQAEMRFDALEELAPDTADTEVAFNHLLLARMEAGRKRFEEEQKSKISVTTQKQVFTTTLNAPKFAHDEIEWLYTNGFYIDEEKLNILLSLPRESLISDLELVLQDSIERYGYFSDLVENEGWDEEEMSFVFHAIYLLGEIESTKSISNIFNFLKQSYEFHRFYLGDLLSTSIWEPVYKMANHNLDTCKQFVFEPGIDTYARTAITDMAEQVAHHQPERRDEVIQWFREVIRFFLNSKLEDNVIDSDFIGLMICNLLDIKAKELMPDVEKLFDKGIVSIGICGKWEDVRIAFNQTDRYDKKREILPIYERYQDITSTLAKYNEIEKKSFFKHKDFFETSGLPIRVEPKIGRNDPCPCGSGKKYKKCCFNK